MAKIRPMIFSAVDPDKPKHTRDAINAAKPAKTQTNIMTAIAIKIPFYFWFSFVSSSFLGIL